MKLPFDINKYFFPKEFSTFLKVDENNFINRLQELKDKKIICGEIDKNNFIVHYPSEFSFGFTQLKSIFECFGKIENNHISYKIQLKEKHTKTLFISIIIGFLGLTFSFYEDIFSLLIVLFIFTFYYLNIRFGYNKFIQFIEFEFQYCITGKYIIQYNKDVPY